MKFSIFVSIPHFPLWNLRNFAIHKLPKFSRWHLDNLQIRLVLYLTFGHFTNSSNYLLDIWIFLQPSTDRKTLGKSLNFYSLVGKKTLEILMGKILPSIATRPHFFTRFIYSWLSLSRPRLSRITAYLEVKIWSLPIHENLTTDGKYCRKEEKLLLRSNFSSFPQYFQYISNFKSPITYQFVKCD